MPTGRPSVRPGRSTIVAHRVRPSRWLGILLLLILGLAAGVAAPAQAESTTRTVPLSAGWSAVVYTGPDVAAATIAADLGADVLTVWDAATQQYDTFYPTLPAALNSLQTLVSGTVVLLQLPAAGTWTMEVLPVSPVMTVQAGWNLLPWAPATALPAADVVAPLGSRLHGLYRLTAAGTFDSYLPALPAQFVTLVQVNPLDALWVSVGAGPPIPWAQVAGGNSTDAVSELDTWSPPEQLQQPIVAPHPTGIAAYDRDDWGGWVDADGDCEDARAEVLIAESQIGVAFRANDPCAVDIGLWFGELTGLTFTLASDVDVDHHVPLANAHLSGGWTWSAAEREAYTNDLGNPDHLLAVDDSTNQSKGSRGPDAWRPPRMDYWCKYAVDWTVVKNNYALTATADEWTALQEMLNTCPGGSPTILPSVPTSPTVLLSAPTSCGGASAEIVSLSKTTTPEVVVISGSGDATGWYLISVTGNQRFDFPTGFQFTAHVEIHSATSAAGSGTILIWTTANVWNNAAEDDAKLFDCNDVLVDHFDG